MTSFGTVRVQQARILDFDTECRPMHYSEWRPESQITAYAWAWRDEKSGTEDRTKGEPSVLTLRHHEEEDEFWDHERELLEEFMDEFNHADIVTGHYLLRHDLPLLVDHCMRLGVALPGPTLVADTKVHMPRIRALGMSQENLGDLLKIDAKKHHMSGRLWAEANNLTRQGRELAAKRVRDDVLQHQSIYDEAVELGWLATPQYWSP